MILTEKSVNTKNGSSEATHLLYTRVMDESNYLERLKTTGRNDPCPCGSGKKYKKCCLDADHAQEHKALEKAAEARAAEAAAAEESGEAKDAKPKKNIRKENRNAGKATVGKSQHANIPRRGAV